ncbi:MAG: exodeoxyribonuclease VII large subunit [Thiobacillus sp.]
MEKSATPIFSVSDFIAVLNQSLEFSYPTVEVEGEVCSFKVNQGKYVFFDLKDEQGSVGCFMTVWQMRVPIEDGMKVIVSAAPKLTQWGKFSLTVRAVRPSGEGAIKKSFDLLKSKLEAEGLFAAERKRPLPKIPKNVGVISSIQAAGYADFIKILNDRWGGVKVSVANVQVQGVGSADQIIRAIEYFNQQETPPEVIVIIRGGGSADDLSTFNDEMLVRAIAGSRVPTLVGVGHEIDVSLADLVADVRAATPSNAAQILVPDKHEVSRIIKAQISALIPRIQGFIDSQLKLINDQVGGIVESINLALVDQISMIENYRKVLTQLNPNTILERGYAILRGGIKLGGNLQIETNEVIINAEVKDVKRK